MFRLSSLLTTLVFGVAEASVAQNSPATIAAAEAEGASYPRAPMPGTVSWAFNKPFGGTAERKCVAVRLTCRRRADHCGLATSSSARGCSSVWPQANGNYKVLWLPLHTPPDIRATLLLRATRIGQPADSIRTRIPAAGTPRSAELGGWVPERRQLPRGRRVGRRSNDRKRLGMFPVQDFVGVVQRVSPGFPWENAMDQTGA